MLKLYTQKVTLKVCFFHSIGFKLITLATLPMTAKKGLLRWTIVQYLSQNNSRTIQKLITISRSYDFIHIYL